MIVFFLSLDSSLDASRYRGNSQVKPELRYLLANIDNIVILSQDTINFESPSPKIKYVSAAYSNFRIVRSLLNRSKYLRWCYFSLFTFFWMMKNRSGIDLIVSQNIDSPFPLVFSKLFNIPYIVHYHYDVGYQVQKYNKQPIIGTILLGIERHAFSRINSVWVTAPNLVSKVKRFGAKHIQVIPNWFDVSEAWTFQSKDNIQKTTDLKHVLFVGRLHPIKQVDLLIKAFRKVYDTHKNLDLLILGDGAERQNLIALTNSLGLSKVIHFFGFVDRQKTYEIMRRSAVLVLPSKLEGNPRVLIEAMMNNVPIIGTNVPGIKDMIHHMKTGYLVNTFQPEELAIGIKWILENDDEVDYIVKEAYVFAEKAFSKENISRKIFNEISQLVPKYRKK